VIRSIRAIATPYLISERQQTRGYDQVTYHQETRDPQLASIVLLCDSPEGTARDPCQTSPQAQTPPPCVILTHELGNVNLDPGRRRKGHFEICRIQEQNGGCDGATQETYGFKGRFIGDSSSARGSTLPECVDCIQAIATPPSIANNTTFRQFVSITQLAPLGVTVSTIRISQKSPMPKERLSIGAPGRGPNNPRTGNIIASTSPAQNTAQSTAWSGANFLFMNMCISTVW